MALQEPLAVSPVVTLYARLLVSREPLAIRAIPQDGQLWPRGGTS